MPFTFFISRHHMNTEIKEFIEISADPLPSLDHVTNLVLDNGAGAISTFSGTTRDTFEGQLNTKHHQIYLTCVNRQESGQARI